LKHPLQFELADILRRDLGEQAMPLAESGSRVGEPVLRLVLGVQDAVERDGTRVLLRPEQARSQEDQKSVSLHSFAQRSHLIAPGVSSATFQNE
jgi:hypothetical protein